MDSNISIRGIVSESGFATTGVYIDDTPIAVRTIFPASNAYPRVFDLERVEVLRGPQGTLFGAGAQGGVVRFITPKPSLTDFSVYARTEGAIVEGGDSNYEAGVAVGGPLVNDKLGFRVSGSYRRDGGWIDRVDHSTGDRLADKDSNWTRTTVLRGALTWAPTPELTITPSLYYQNFYQNDSFGSWESLSNPSKGVYVNGFGLAQPSRDRFYLPSLAISYDLGPAALESNTSLFSSKLNSTYDYTSFIGGVFGGTAFPYEELPGYFVRADFSTKQKTYTQEVRLRSTNPDARLRWVVGAFWTRMAQQTLQADYDPQFPELIDHFIGLTIPEVFGPTARTDTVFDRYNMEDTVDKQLSGFAQFDFRIFDGLTATAGLRVSKTNFRFQHDEFGMAVSENHTGGTARETPVTPKFGLTWQVDHDNMIYASAAKGFRIGGANPVQNPIACAADFARLGITANPIQYKSDTVWNYELGAKGALFARRLRLAASVFRIDWTGIQRPVSLSTCGLNYIDNLGTARSEGFDLTAQGRPIEGLTLGLDLGYNKAKFTETIRAASGAIIVDEGDSLGTPKWTVHPSAEYEFDFTGAHKAYLRADYQFIGKLGRTPELNPVTTSYDKTLYALKSRSITDLRTGVRLDNFDISIFANNVFGSSSLTSRSHYFKSLPLYFIMAEKPRTIGVTVVGRY